MINENTFTISSTILYNVISNVRVQLSEKVL